MQHQRLGFEVKDVSFGVKDMMDKASMHHSTSMHKSYGSQEAKLVHALPAASDIETATKSFLLLCPRQLLPAVHAQVLLPG